MIWGYGMFNRLLTLYPNAFITDSVSGHLSAEYHCFSDGTGSWLCIPKKDLCKKELKLLRTLYPENSHPFIDSHLNILARKWRDFLFQNGSIPVDEEKVFRTICFQYTGTKTDNQEFEAAIRGFFSDDVIVIWLSETRGVIVEEKKGNLLTEENFVSIVNTFESDFFINIYLYPGKFRSLSEQFAKIFQQDFQFFIKGIKLLPKERIITFEKVFPVLLAEKLDPQLKEILTGTLLPILKDDHDILATVKLFIENNLNTSLTAKKLYIHRNTLQYRIEKFIEKTGINLKDFYGAFTVYLACLLTEINDI